MRPIQSALVATLFVCPWMGPSSLAADPSWGQWASAKQYFDAGKYDEALNDFRAYPAETAQYFHNVGTTYLKMGQPGAAVAHLGKASRLKPHDPEILRNLQVAQNSLGQLIGRDRLDPASSTVEALADRASLDEVRAALGLLGLIVLGLWFRAYLRTRNLKKTFLQPTGLMGLLGFALVVVLYSAERLAESHPPAYVLERLVIRSGPGDQYAQLGQAEAGVKLRLLGPSQSIKSATGTKEQVWDQVRYSQDSIGWVPTSSLLRF